MSDTSLVRIVVGYSDRIENGRTKAKVFEAIKDEVEELHEEVMVDKFGIAYGHAGEDGIFGECVDILASVLDLIRLERPNATIEELETEVAAYLDKKCQKWASKHG